MADPETGRLEQPLASHGWMVPAVVKLDADWGDWLVWEWGEFSFDRDIRSGDGLLEGFLQLVEASPERIRDYAKRWGILGIADHVEWNGDPAPFPSRYAGTPPPLSGGEVPAGGAEPLDVWRGYARRARAIAGAAASLYQGHSIRAEEWEWCFRPGYVQDVLTPPWHQRPGFMGLSEAVDQWLTEADAGRLRVSWLGNARPSIDLELGSAPLFGAIGLELLFAVGKSDGLQFCTNCAVPFFPNRQASRGTRRYCPACQEAKVGQRDAARDYRARKKAGGRVLVDGNLDGNR